MTWNVTVLTLFPEMFPGTLGFSLAQKALLAGHWSLNVINIRDFAFDRHRSVDDTPFGGGAGMVLRPDVLENALESVLKKNQNPNPLIFYLSPRGDVFKQETAHTFLKSSEIIFICGRYEGIDQRFLDYYKIQELSIGDYVLFGGEVAVQVVLETCIRLIPGAIGTEDSLCEESFTKGLLEYPHYTRPSLWKGISVPDVLTSGHHEAIRSWRRLQSEEITNKRRPDLKFVKESSTLDPMKKKGGP
ncbi:MAG: tRNA (guanosine(37)-N1)-methyltransferase TrmD [Proteobacteria bacterium]|nr:tRNA (guanosine(37)-N1)-methyltransferase TrmD [Pseudomonadota bacterium]